MCRVCIQGAYVGCLWCRFVHVCGLSTCGVFVYLWYMWFVFLVCVLVVYGVFLVCICAYLWCVSRVRVCGVCVAPVTGVGVTLSQLLMSICLTTLLVF